MTAPLMPTESLPDPRYVDSSDLGEQLTTARGELARLRNSLERLCLEADAHSHLDLPTGGLVSVRRIRAVIKGES